jgi:hypothetical protein
MAAVKTFIADHCAERGLGWQEAVAELQKLWGDNDDLGLVPAPSPPSPNDDDDDDPIWPPIQENGVLIAR